MVIRFFKVSVIISLIKDKFLCVFICFFLQLRNEFNNYVMGICSLCVIGKVCLIVCIDGCIGLGYCNVIYVIVLIKLYFVVC